MKRMKKILALLVACVFVFAMAVPAMAAALPEETQGNAKTITITSPEGLAATDKTTYHVYKIFNATNDGTSKKITYTEIADHTPGLPITATDNLSKFDKDSAGNIHYYTRANTVDSWTENTTATELSAGMIAAIGTYVASDAEIGSVEITGPNTSKTVTVPDYGYYYITTTTGTVVTIDSTNPSATVSDKNPIPSVDKSITGITNNGTVENGEGTGNENEVGKGKIGDVVTYQVIVHAQPGAVNYIFHDKLSEGLSLEAQSNLNISVGGTLIAASNYSVQYWSDTDATNQTDTAAGDNITIRFSNDYLKTLTAATDITISYKAKINDNAVIASTGNPNKVDLDYGHDPTDTSNPTKPTKKTEEDEATVYTYALALKKVNESGAPLADATFQLPFYVKSTPAADGSYIYAGTSAGEGLVNTLTTPQSGEITIKGVQNVAYTFEETVAPNGYNKLTETFTITPEVTSATTTKTTKTVYLDENGNVVNETYEGTKTTVTYTNSNMAVGGFKVVVNKAGSELPATGGIGRTIFYIVGAILVVGAAIVLVSRRKMNAEK